MSGYSEEYASAWSHRIQRARKEHRCCACQSTIRAGDRYAYESIVSEGTVDVYKRCLRCETIYQELRRRQRARRSEIERQIRDAPDRDERDRLYDLLDDLGNYVDAQLACGHRWEEVHGGPPPDEIARLAFLTADEAQELEL